MRCIVVAVLVEPGQPVRWSERLLILEAMRVENEIRAPQMGVIEAPRAVPEKRLSQGGTLVRFVS